jgi:hypothetical protein
MWFVRIFVDPLILSCLFLEQGIENKCCLHAGTLYHLKMQIKQRTDRRANKPGAPPKAAEPSKNHVFCLAIFTLQT